MPVRGGAVISALALVPAVGDVGADPIRRHAQLLCGCSGHSTWLDVVDSSLDISGIEAQPSTVEKPIVFWPTERDEANLAVLEVAGLSRDEAIRAALMSLAADCMPVALALSRTDATA